MDNRCSGRERNSEPKKVGVEPIHKLPDGFRPPYWALFKIEQNRNPSSEKQNPRKVTYSPKTFRTFLWKEKDGHWEKNKNLCGTFKEVVEAYRKHHPSFDGYGYILEPDVPVPGTEGLYPIVTDLDDCRNHENGYLEPWAIEIIEAQRTFIELSPSGKGVHLIGLGKKKPGSRMVFPLDGQKIENYGGNVGMRRFMTYTGVALEGYDKPLGHEGVQEWIDENVPIKESGNKGPIIPYEDLVPEISDDVKDKIVRICERIERNNRGELFKKLFDEGDWSYWTTKSEAEISLLNILAWVTLYLFEDEEKRKKTMQEIFVASAFYRNTHRNQWEEDGYLDRQIENAIVGCTSGYTGKPKEQLLRQLEVLRIDYDWAAGGRDKPNPRAAYGAHITLAYDHGRYIRAGEVVPGLGGEPYTIPETGVLVHSSARDISLISGVQPTVIEKDNGEEDRDYRNITKLNDGLEEMGLLRRIYRGGAGGTASLYLLPKSVVGSHEFSSLFSLNTHNQEPHLLLMSEQYQQGERWGSGLCVSREKILLTEKLNWIQEKDITPKQRFLVEQVTWGRKTFKELAEYFGGDPKPLRYNVVNPLLKKGLLFDTEEGYEVDVEAVHRTFVESGGEMLLKREKKAVEAERSRHHQKLEEHKDEIIPVDEGLWDRLIRQAKSKNELQMVGYFEPSVFED